MVMEERTLHVTVISAKDLKKVKNFGQQSCYAVAYIYENDKKSTRVDKDGGLNPTWNSELTLTCDDKLLQGNASFITINIYSYGAFGKKIVGTVTIPLLDVAKEATGSKAKFMAFEVRRPSGKGKGVLNLSVKVGEKRTVSQPTRNKKETSNGYSAYSQGYEKQRPGAAAATPMGYPQAHPSTGSKVDSFSAIRPTAASSVAGGSSVHPPPQASRNGASASSAGSVYPPKKTSNSNSSSKVEEPVMAYPAPGYAGGYPQQYNQQYGQQYGPQYGGQQYYPSSQANAPYNYQQAYYSRPPRRQGGGSGLGMGLLGGALGGLLLGDIIGGDFGGF